MIHNTHVKLSGFFWFYLSAYGNFYYWRLWSMQNLKCDMQCVKNSNRELITVCAAYLHPSSPPLLHGNEAMNGSMSTGRGSRRGMQLWTPTRETRRHVSFPSLRLPPEGLVLKWHRGGCREAWLVENKKILTVVAERNETGQGHVTWASGGCVLSCVRLSFMRVNFVFP